MYIFYQEKKKKKNKTKKKLKSMNYPLGEICVRLKY